MPRTPFSGIAGAPHALVVAELDSIEQRQIFDSAPDVATAVSTIVGLLRAALLVTDEIHLTDSMLFDGAFFAEVGPRELAEQLGTSARNLPLVILSTPYGGGADDKAVTDLDRAFHERFGDPEFVWQLKRLGLTRADIDDHARRWLEAGRDHVFVVRPWGTRTSNPVHPTGFLSAESALPMPVGLSEHGQALADAALGDRRRSDLVARLDRARHAQIVPVEEIDVVDEWWRGAYLRELATRNDIGWVRFSPEDPREEDVHPAPNDRRHGVLTMTGKVVEVVTAATPTAFGHARFSVREQRARFLERPTSWRLNSLSFSTLEALTSSTREALLRSAVLRSVLAALVAVLSSSFARSTEGAFALAVGGAIVVATIPWADLWESFRLLRLAPSARLKVYRAPD